MKAFLLIAATLLALPSASTAQSFEGLLAEARGKTVYFNAWGGSPQINAYIEWAAEQVSSLYDIEIQHVKLNDTTDAVTRILAELEAGRDQDGSVDLLWVNGENFQRLKENNALFGPFSESLPNYQFTDPGKNPTLVYDFSVPVDGFESPWGQAQFVLIYDTAISSQPPGGLTELLEYAKANPGRITYPRITDFIGATFVKHVLLEKASSKADLSQPPGENAVHMLEPVFAYLDELHQHAWRRGQAFPAAGPQLHQLFEDGEIDLTMAFNPAEASSLVLDGRFPATTKSYTFENGTIGNTHFLAIPANASSPDAAQVVANFLLSPEAQAKKMEPAVWGDFTVLSMEKLSSEHQELFAKIERHSATPAPEEMARTLPEPHAAWVDLLEQAWLERYGQ